MSEQKLLPANIQLPMDVGQMLEAFDGNTDLLLFFVTWIKNGMNATKAYLELHPHVTEHSARVLGSRVLAKVSKDMIYAAYGLDAQLYFTQLREGMQATKWNDFTGEREADHNTRRPYHDKLGKLLGIESNIPAIAVQINNVVGSKKNEYGI